jgi:PAS domain S-box-containing protein
VWNTQFQITRFNKAFESLTGRNEMYVIGKSLEILFPPDLRERSMELVRKSVALDQTDAFEINILHLDGSIRTFLWNSATINSVDGKIQIGAIAQGLDITLRKQAEEQLRQENEILRRELDEKTRQFENREKRVAELFIAKEIAEEADKLKTAFLENISHKIRTPLNGIIGFSDLLNQEDLNTDEIKEFTGLISQSGQHLLEIVNNVLDISKIKTGQVRIEQKPILINLIFSELLNFFHPVAKAKNISLNFQNLDDQYNMIFTDESKLIQILTNLISNALKFTKSGSIDCGFEIKGDYIQLFVRDTGVGIRSELYNKIFDRFAYSEQSLSADNEGTGFGLSITKGLVNLLGGNIWVESIVDKGSVFYFTLPYTPIELPSERVITNEEIQVKRPNRIILIAEDDWISFQYLRTILEKSDITVIHAENGVQAVELVKNTSDIDLILMDIKMPVMDGIEATKLIKRLRPDLPIIAQTAYVFDEDKIMISSIGCDQYLAKPLDYAKLKELLNMYLN